MEVLTFPPTPPAGPVVALPSPPVSRPVSEPEGWRAWVEQGCRVLWNLLLLPLRVAHRFALDLQAALLLLFLGAWELGLASLGLAFILGIVAVESFGENFFMGELFKALFPGMRAYVPDATALGMWLAAGFPALDDVRASTIFAFVVAGGAVLATSISLHNLRRWQQEGTRSLPAFQEALMLDPQGQESPPPPPKPLPRHSPALVGMVVGAGAQALILGFEVYAFALVLESALFGVLSSLLLLGVRLVFGFVAHFGLGYSVLHGRAAAEHMVGFGTGLLRVVPNAVGEVLHRLETLESA